MDVTPVAKKILYITYDGLTDPLGQSQILPYLKGLASHGYEFTILSFEKKDRFQKEQNIIKKLTGESNIRWVPLWFTSKPPLLSKFYDALQMRKKAVELQRQYRFDMVHCRSYIAADVGLFLKRKFGVKFFFDMRGFWADEKKDGSWNVSNPVFKRVYKYYKKKEAQYLHNADYIISLTEAGKNEMMHWPSYNKNVPLKVIPCCADMDHFSLTSKEQKKQSRKELKISETSLVISYLGSIGTWYMLDEMLLFFKQIKLKYADAKFLILTHSTPALIYSKASLLKIDASDFLIKEVSRGDVPKLIKASDINLSFIKPVYSKISSSPTKLGEVLSMGIPVICNSGVGDVEKIIEKTGGGYVLHEFNEKEFSKAINMIPSLLEKNPQEIRSNAEGIYDLKKGIEHYRQSYQAVFNKMF
ncbi:MAG: glycosyltransferase [Ferruginibacter sp.]